MLTVGLVAAPPDVAVPRTEVHAVQLASASTIAPAPTPAQRPAAGSQTAKATSAPPDFLAFAASILEYLNSLGLGAGPGLAAIGLTGFVVAFAATAYAWNAFADTVNPGLRFLHIPRVPKFRSASPVKSAAVRVRRRRGSSRPAAVWRQPTAPRAAPGVRPHRAAARPPAPRRRSSVARRSRRRRGRVRAAASGCGAQPPAESAQPAGGGSIGVSEIGTRWVPGPSPWQPAPPTTRVRSPAKPPSRCGIQ